VTNLLHSYDAAGGSLIVIVGATDQENGWIGEGVLLASGNANVDVMEMLMTISVGGACRSECLAPSQGTKCCEYRCYECGDEVYFPTSMLPKNRPSSD
jgi:hypothetical protein